MYVPAEHSTSTTAIGRTGSARSHSSIVELVDDDVPRRQLDGLAGRRAIW